MRLENPTAPETIDPPISLHSLFEYMNGKARREIELSVSISPRQLEKIDETFRLNAEKFVGTDAFIAMQNDIEMFGEDAFSQRQADSKPNP